MAKVELYICDINKCDNEVKPKKAGIPMQVIFTTEQNEGRPVKPYFHMTDLDICDSCLSKILHKESYITARGAMGNNCYEI
jgi:hypothetical protein